MYSIEVPARINQIIYLFNFLGLWQGEKRTIFRTRMTKILHLTAYACYTISIAAGSFNTDSETEQMFLGVIAIIGFIITVRLYYFLWKNDQIFGFIHKLGAHSIKNSEEFNKINIQIRGFAKFGTLLVLMLIYSMIALTIFSSPIFSKEKHLPMSIYVPANWQQNETLFWLAFVFVEYGLMISFIGCLMDVVIWYLMMSCAIKYEIFGNDLRSIGYGNRTTTTAKINIIPNKKHQSAFHAELIVLIKYHQNLQEITKQFQSCFSNLFLIQIATSAASICGSVYVLAFTSVENPFVFIVFGVVLFFNFFDIFMVMYFGNEITFSSSCLSYCLFESNWIGQSQSSIKHVFTFMGILERPQELVVGIYPLNLEIFTQILKLAYSMFNILQNLK